MGVVDVPPGLALHDDAALAAALGSAVVARRTVHAWPGSCVQDVRLADGSRWAYKSQRAPTVEPAFYAAATSPLLAAHRDFGALAECVTLAIAWIDAPPLRAAGEELVAHGRRLVAAIAGIGGDLPTHLDVTAQWDGIGERCTTKLAALVADGRFTALTTADVDAVASWAAARDWRVFAPVVAHGDLMVSQVFVADDGYRVIDWQRPVRGPGDLDLVALLVDQGVDPGPHAHPEVVGLYWFLRLLWAVEGQHDRHPASTVPLLEGWAAQAVAALRSAG